MVFKGLKRVLDEVQHRFAYSFAPTPYPGAPRLKLESIDDLTAFEWGKLTIQPIPIQHGALDILGYRIGDLAYLTDVKNIPESGMQLLKGLNTLVISALHHRPHHSHQNLEEAIQTCQKIGAQQSWLTHCSHSMGLYADINKTLPPDIQLGFDGLILEGNL